MPTSLQAGCGRAEGRPGKSANRSRSTLNNELIFLLGLTLDRLDEWAGEHRCGHVEELRVGATKASGGHPPLSLSGYSLLAKASMRRSGTSHMSATITYMQS